METELKIKRALRRSAVIHADEEGLRVQGKLAYVHVASNARLTHYAADTRWGKAAIDEIDILPSYRGTCVHDGWLSYIHYPSCRHALCGAHLLRELTYFEELGEVTKAWAAPLKELLLEMKGEAEREGAPVPAWLVEELTARYNRRVAEGQASNLLRRLVRRKKKVLRFLSDPSVPFDNNLAERDLRMVKPQQKVSGCFRTGEAARRFCRIRPYVSTAREQGRGMLEAQKRSAPSEVRLSPSTAYPDLNSYSDEIRRSPADGGVLEMIVCGLKAKVVRGGLIQVGRRATLSPEILRLGEA